jgi:hypothetical protein
MRVLEKIARALSGKYDVNVVFRGTEGMTDGKNIILPALPEDYQLTPEMELKIKGLNDHETAHIRYSKNSIGKKDGVFAMIAEHRDPKTIKVLTNLFEDIRIEKLMGIDFPGAGENMAKASQLIEKEHPQIGENIIGKLLCEGQRQVLGYAFDMPDCSVELMRHFGSDL